MSRFTGTLKVDFSEAHYALLWEDLVWEEGFEGSGVEIRVPKGFTSDGASVPRFLWWLMPAWGDLGTRAAILHDWLLDKIKDMWPSSEYNHLRRHADQQFLEALLACKVAPWRARLCYWGVRAYATYYGSIAVYLRKGSVLSK